jgi:NAD(P)-dependent dehydrogenase (short-subunit alcohol dehydrogenase family)
VPDRVLITGASGGIGLATVDAFREAGYEVLGLDIEPCPERDGFECRVADLTDPAAVRDALDGAGPIRHVISIAGGALPAEKARPDIVELPLETFRASVELNLISAFVTLQATLPLMRGLDCDRSVAFTTSTDAMVSYGLPAYAAAKAGLVGLVRSLVTQLGAEGIRINAVAPGDIPTKRNLREWAHQPNHYDEIAARTPLGRLVTAGDIATMFLAIADGVSSITGQVIVVDGGATAVGPQGVSREVKTQQARLH